MRQSITPHTVANEVRMMRTQHKGTLVIVEGPSDKSAYLNLVDQRTCRIVIAHGKENATGALQILESDDLRGMLAIVDADFMHLEKGARPSENLLVTDLHDLECMMMASSAFGKLLSEYAVPARVEAFEQRAACPLQTALARNAMIIGYFRWVSLREDLALDFEDLSFGKFLSRTDLHVDVSKLIMEVKNRSQKHALADSDIHSQIESLRDPKHDAWQVSCGHDIIGILSFALRRTIAARKESEVSPKALERAVRLAYEMSHFQQTELYKSIQFWESVHSPYRVLPR
ncbi:MAG: DUF4435 domain-containing protein [Planctomycetota bacterium]|jgi:hypothetical protein